MAVSKVILDGVTQMDVTGNTNTANTILQGYTGTKNDGTEIIGAYVPSSITLQEKTNINPTTSSQTITPDSGYDGLSSVQINAMPAMTLPTSTAQMFVGTEKTTVTPTTAPQYINIPIGYNSANAHYKILGETDLVAGNIKKDVTIFGVTGTYSSAIQTYTNISSVSSRTLTIDGIYTSPSFFILQANYPSTSTAIPAGRSDILYVYYNGTIATGGGIQTATLQNPTIISLTFSVSIGNGYLQIYCNTYNYTFTNSRGYTLYCLY